MTATLTADIAGLTFVVHAPDETWLRPLADYLAAFLVPNGQVGRNLVWHVVVRNEWTLSAESGAWIQHDEMVTRFGLAGYGGQIDLATRQAVVWVSSEANACVALERELAYICLLELPRQGRGLLLHGAGVSFQGQGLVFSGPSGAGKTTIARLADRFAEVLTDEHPIIVWEGQQASLVSTPFWGTSTPQALIRRVNKRIPLRALFLLEHSSGFELVPLDARAAMASLLATEVVAAERMSSAEAWLATADRLLHRVPTYRLRFRPSSELWPYLAQHLADRPKA